MTLSAASAAGSWGGCSASRDCRWGSRSGSSTPRPTRARKRSESSSWRRTTIPTAEPAGRRRGGGHVRVRERARRGGCERGCAARTRSPRARPGPAREKELFRSLGIPTARFGSLEEAGSPRARQDAAPRLRRQRPASGRMRRSHWETASSRRRSSPSTASSRSSAFAGGTETRAFGRSAENVHLDGILRVTRAPAAERSAGAKRRRSAPRFSTRSTTSACSPWSCSRSPAGCLRTSIAPRVHNTAHWTIDGRGDEPVREPPPRDRRPAARAGRRRSRLA